MKHFISDKKYFAINDPIPFKIFSKVIDFQLKNPQIITRTIKGMLEGGET